MMMMMMMMKIEQSAMTMTLTVRNTGIQTRVSLRVVFTGAHRHLLTTREHGPTGRVDDP